MKILIVEDQPALRTALVDELRDIGHDLASAKSGEDAIEMMIDHHFDLVISDLVMLKLSGLDVLRHIKSRGFNSAFILMTAHATLDSAIEALRFGALDYLCKPFEIEQVLNLVQQAEEIIQVKQAKLNIKERNQQTSSPSLKLIGNSTEMKRVYATIKVVANSNTTVLIEGETGTGKGVVAETIHISSLRQSEAFVTVCCASLPGDLLESELFGYEKGAFTGAVKRKKGRFELAHKGTIFLDEIDDIPLFTQVKLLRVIQTGQLERLGGEETIHVDVRIIAASKKNLLDLVTKGLFRQDLYYRLNVIRISLPALRDRKNDIPLLLNHFIKKFNPSLNIDMSKEMLNHTMNKPWKGNVRELENYVERFVLLYESGVHAGDHELFHADEDACSSTDFQLGKTSLPTYLYKCEQNILRYAEQTTNSNRIKMAELLQIPLPTLKSKLKKFCE